MKFKKLHNQDDPLLLANVWDISSSRVAERAGFQAIGTSSSAMAAMLGYADGEAMPFAELEYLVKRIAANTTLPLSVDLEGGYSRKPAQIVTHIKRLAALGVVGINIEDSVVNDKRSLLDVQEFANTLAEINHQLVHDKIDIFINVRTDAFILGHPEALKETMQRIDWYEKAGANGIFTPGIEKENDIQAVVDHTNLPVNVMCMPRLSDFATLKMLGVKRISMGNFLFDKMYKDLAQSAKNILTQQSFKTVF